MSLPDNCYFLKPEPGGDDLFAVADLLAAKGFELSQSRTSIVARLAAKDLLRDHGPRSLLNWGPLNESVLPDNTPRDVLIDTLRYQLNRCQPTASLLVIDPYLFPSRPDANYRTDLVSLLEPAARAGLRLDIATGQTHNAALMADVLSDLRAINPAVIPTVKLTDDFHDRFWIADGVRGLFIGTSINGIGRRYAIADYLEDEDAIAINARYAAVP